MSDKIATESQTETTAQDAVEIEEDQTENLVIYCDGGCRPNPGFGGWGIHGYLFKAVSPKKANGHPDHAATAEGYISKAESSLRMGLEGKEDRRRYDRSIEVTPTWYVDGFGSLPGPVTNNVAELEAAIQAFQFALTRVITKIKMWSDSKYVCDGLQGGAHAWRTNGWLRPDMSEPANIGYWKKLLDLHDRLRDRGIIVDAQWIRSHSEFLGNETVDRHATAGVFASQRREIMGEIVVREPQDYWRKTVDRHPFIASRKLYFNTMAEYVTPGEYYLGDHGKDDDNCGKRTSDGAFAVVVLKQPDPVIETMRNMQVSVSGGMDSIIFARVDALYTPENYENAMLYGRHAFYQPAYDRLDLHFVTDEPVTRERRPAKLAMRAVESLSDLAEKLDKFLNKDPELTVTDLTVILYETTVKTKKKGEPITQVKLKSEYNVGFAALQVDANYKSEDGVKSAPVTLTLGIDLLGRNALKRLEDLAPKVSLISWLESPNVFRYATVVEAGEDKGIWAGVYSNLRVVS